MPGANALITPPRQRPSGDAAELVRQLAREGTLTDRFMTGSPTERARLSSGAYAIAWLVTFEGLTRRLEFRRGHPRCAAGIRYMAPECFDRFQDDVEAVLDDLFRRAKVPIHHLEGWIAGRLLAAATDGHRRRRGARGAQQRPRLPRWLAQTLNDDPWLTVLALEVLVWVGVPVTAGTGLWPVGAWAQRRALVTGDHDGEARTARDVETVLDAMRRRPKWYDRYVERPLGRKQAPVMPADGADPGLPRAGRYPTPAERPESDDARLLDLAALAIAAIRDGLRHGEEPAAVVVNVLSKAFGPGTGVEDMDRAPGEGSVADQRVAALLADPTSIDRLVAQVLDILATGDRHVPPGP